MCGNGRNKGASGCAASLPVQFIEHSRPLAAACAAILFAPGAFGQEFSRLAVNRDGFVLYFPPACV
jgi:hypothetical protein